MTTKHKLLAIAAFVLATFAFSGVAQAIFTYTVQTQTQSFQNFNFLSATTTSATSTNLAGGGGYLTIAGAKKVTFHFSRGGATNPNTGSTRFFVQVSPDANTWYYWGNWSVAASTTNSFTAVTQTTAQYTLTGTSTISAGMILDNNTYQYARCIAVETTDGEHTCDASVEF